MADIVITPITPQDREQWAALWRGYLDFYETDLPPEVYEHTWQRLITAATASMSLRPQPLRRIALSTNRSCR